MTDRHSKDLRKLTLRVNQDLYEYLISISKKFGVSMSHIVRQMIVDKYKEEFKGEEK